MLEKLSSIFICRIMHLLWQSEIKIKAKVIACSVLNTIHLKNKKHAVIRATLEKQRARLTIGLSRSSLQG